jgi:hypothetical protein
MVDTDATGTKQQQYQEPPTEDGRWLTQRVDLFELNSPLLPEDRDGDEQF